MEGSGLLSPTPVQMVAVPAALAGQDLLVSAPTGSGKTLAFALPLIMRVLKGTSSEERSPRPQALILAPTRELAAQIQESVQELVAGVPVMRTALLVGGIPISHQLHRLRSGAQIAVATPARLIALIKEHPSDIDLADVRVLVVDEVDCLLEMGFESQFNEIEASLPARRQTLMFSATVPAKVERTAYRILNQPLTITFGRSRDQQSGDQIKHTVIWVEEASKRKKLLAIMDDPKHYRPPVLVFVSSRAGALLLAEAINKLRPSQSAVGFHGDMAQETRSEILQGCLQNKYSVVVATNVLGRGIYFGNVRQVILFDMPTTIQEFIHQVGRAGDGWAYSFINNSNKSLFHKLLSLLPHTRLPPQLAAHHTRKRSHDQESHSSRDSLLAMIQSSSKKSKSSH